MSLKTDEMLREQLLAFRRGAKFSADHYLRQSWRVATFLSSHPDLGGEWEEGLTDLLRLGIAVIERLEE